MELDNKKKLGIALLATLGVGAIGGYCTASEIDDWYESLVKPFFNPPNYVFGPVWTILYVMMAYSFYLIWKEEPSDKRKWCSRFFIAQLAVNLSWSFVFFKAHAIGQALIDIGIMWVLINITIGMYNRINKLAAWLMVPYMLWVSFASVLNYALWLMNKH